MKKILFYHLATLFLLVLAVEKSTANTNYVSGYISYHSHDSLWYAPIYQFTVNLYTYKDSLPPEIIVVVNGDNTTDSVNKTDSINLSNNIVLSQYTFTHAFPTPGIYTIVYSDTFAILKGINIDSSFDMYFFISTTISIPYDPFLWNHNSANFYDYPLVQAQINDTFHYNPIAIEHDTDSLSFSLIPHSYCYIPQGVTINPISGEIIWINPSIPGSYSFYLLVNQWRKNEQGYAVNIGGEEKYFTINVQDFHSSFQFQNIQNWDTNSYGYYQYILYPNQNLQLFFSYSDSTSDSIKVVSNGDIYSINDPPSFSAINSANQVYGLFSWTPQVSNVRGNPYIVCFVGSSYIDSEVISNYVTVLVYVIDSSTTSGIKELSNVSLQVLVYPNPNNGKLILEWNNLNSVDAIINIYNSIGINVYSEKINHNEGHIIKEISLENPSDGIYLVNINVNNKLISKKFIIQK